MNSRAVTYISALFLLLLCNSCQNRGHGDGATGLPTYEDDFLITSQDELNEYLGLFEQYPDDYKILSSIWWYYTRTGMSRELVSHAIPVYLRADFSGNTITKAYAGTYLAQAYLVMNRYDSVKYYVESVSDIIDKKKITNLAVILNNVKAIHSIQEEMDYAKGLDYFNVALELSRQNPHKTNTGLILCNIANIYYIRNDPSGLPYALEAYDLGKETLDEDVHAYGTMLLAQIYLLTGDYNKAKIYATELEELSGRPTLRRHRNIAKVILAEIAATTGDMATAEIYYNQGAAFLEQMNDESTVIRFYSSYGNFLLSAGEPAKAKVLFEEGLRLSLKNKNLESRHSFLLGLSKANLLLGNKDKALDYYKFYHEHSDSIQSRRREQEFNQLLLRYEKLNYENEINEKELSLEKATRKVQAVIYLFAIAVVAMGSIYIIYRKKYLMYRKLVEKHQKVIHMEQDFRSERKVIKENHSSPIDEQDRILYEKLEILMTRDKLYRNNDLSLDKIAEILDSNRSYVSRLINKYSGMTFYNYINSHRMREAVTILSDPENDIPLKVLYRELGFNALSAFYRSFQKETGVPPSKYREEIRRLSRIKKPLS